MATGSLLNLCDAVVTGRVKNGFALIRPPGHHAEPGQSLKRRADEQMRLWDSVFITTLVLPQKGYYRNSLGRLDEFSSLIGMCSKCFHLKATNLVTVMERNEYSMKTQMYCTFPYIDMMMEHSVFPSKSLTNEIHSRDHRTT